MNMKMFMLFLSLSLFMSLFLAVNVNAASSLALSVTTDKPSYRLGVPTLNVPQTIDIGGNLTWNGAPASGGLVGMTVFQGKVGQYVRPVLYRTLTTGPLSPQTWPLNLSVIVDALKGVQYVPQTVFTCPSNQTSPGPAFNVTFENTGSSPLLSLYLMLTIFDARQVPIATINYTVNEPIPIGETTSIFFTPTALQSWVALGNATVYVSAFDSYSIPPYTYFPYCPEASARFMIVPDGGSQASSQETPNAQTEQVFSSSTVKGNYNFAFNLSYPQDPYSSASHSPWGNYTVEVCSSYQSQQVINSYTFWVKIAGDVNGDGIVNIKDVTIIALYWLQKVPPAPAYADLLGDGIINLKDVVAISLTWLDKQQTLP